MCYEKDALNVLKTELKPCSIDPLTGFYRDGHCKTYNNDIGEHNMFRNDNRFFKFFKKYG